MYTYVYMCIYMFICMETQIGSGYLSCFHLVCLFVLNFWNKISYNLELSYSAIPTGQRVYRGSPVSASPSLGL